MDSQKEKQQATLEPISEQIKKFQDKLEGRAQAEPTTELPSELKQACDLCGIEQTFYFERQRKSSLRCDACKQAVILARRFNGSYCVVPKRYREAWEMGRSPAEMQPGRGYLLFGPPGSGKTDAAWGFMAVVEKNDPRRTRAAYSWPAVLLELRRGYSNKASDATDMIDALRTADVVLLDDLGAEKITASNADWIRETLFVILDERWAEMRQTVLTTNVNLDALPNYLGDRIVSRILGMCEVLEIAGKDRRVFAATDSDLPEGCWDEAKLGGEHVNK